MRHISTILLAAMTAIVVTSCSENTVGGGMIQKRKYTKGFYLNRHSSGKSADETTVQAVSVKEEQTLAVKEDAIRPLEAKAESAAMPETFTTASDGAFSPGFSAPAHSVPASGSGISTPVTESFTAAENSGPVKGKFTMKQKREAVQQAKRAAAGGESGAMLVLLVILAIIIPPLAVFLYEGVTTRFWIDLILAILGFGIGFWLLGGLGWLCALAAVIYALLIVLGVI